VSNRSIDFTGQAVIVTGAGRGLGRLYAMEFARRGAAVVVNDLGGSMGGEGSDACVADEVVSEIVSIGGTAVPSHDSIATPEGGRAVVQIAVDHFGRLDAVISNAGIFSTCPFEDLAVEDWKRMLNVHVDGGFYLSQPAFKVMKAQGFGRFVFIASSAGMFGQPNSAHYAAAKAGLVGLTNVIAIEGEPHGILANSVLPFGFSRMVYETIGLGVDAAKDDPFLSAIKPELVVPLVVFLASKDCDFTHRNYSAGAGRYARVFVGLAHGWMAAQGTEPTAEDILNNIDDVSAPEPYTIPGSIVDEVLELANRLNLT
jgi:NAD(P)-dependent dehydrogenase (short-subunit alcohol dehydrogenase family)